MRVKKGEMVIHENLQMYTKNKYNLSTQLEGLTSPGEYRGNYNKNAVTLHHKPIHKRKKRVWMQLSLGQGDPNPCGRHMSNYHHCQVAI